MTTRFCKYYHEKTMIKTILIAACSLTTFAGIASAGAAEGKDVYTAKCQTCHGPNGEGKAAIEKMFNVTMPKLGSSEVQGLSDADLKKVILTGKGKMKPVAGITEKQADDIVAHVRTLKQ
jgi:mono/diheme cytochrome c family protein